MRHLPAVFLIEQDFSFAKEHGTFSRRGGLATVTSPPALFHDLSGRQKAASSIAALGQRTIAVTKRRYLRSDDSAGGVAVRFSKSATSSQSFRQ